MQQGKHPFGSSSSYQASYATRNASCKSQLPVVVPGHLRFLLHKGLVRCTCIIIIDYTGTHLARQQGAEATIMILTLVHSNLKIMINNLRPDCISGDLAESFIRDLCERFMKFLGVNSLLVGLAGPRWYSIVSRGVCERGVSERRVSSAGSHL